MNKQRIRQWLERPEGKDLWDYGQGVAALAKWLVLSICIGLIIGAVSSGFGHVLIFVNNLRVKYPAILLTLPLGGLLIVLLYRACRNTSDKGTNTVVASIQESTDIPFKMAPLIFISTTITQLCGGSAGREGAALQLGGSIAKKLAKALRLKEDSHRTMVMCGMSAGFSALFGTPLAAAVFSLEVVSVGIMHYAALVPCVIASFTAHLVAQFFRMPPEVFPILEIPAVSALSLLKILGFAAIVGLVSILFCLLLHNAEHLYERYIKNQYLRIALSGCILVGLTILLGTDLYLGSGMGIIEQILHHGHAVPWYSFALKMLFTAVTLGAGFKGGEIVPSFTIGAALGCVCAPLLGLPMELVAACGMAGLFCGVTNSPITALLIAFELFGFAGMPYFLVTVAVSYMLSGYESLYHKQKIIYAKLQTTFTAKN